MRPWEINADTRPTGLGLKPKLLNTKSTGFDL